MIFELAQLFVVSLLISVTTFGGGSQALYYQYAVVQNQWIANIDLSAALAFGYATPGPAVFGLSAFIGYNIAGVPGALVGALGIFVIPFLAACTVARFLSHLLHHPRAAYIIQSIGLAAGGLVAATALSILDLKTAQVWQILIAVISCFVILKWRINPLLILLTGLFIGIAV